MDAPVTFPWVSCETVRCNLCGADEPDVLLDATGSPQRSQRDLQYAASGDTPLQDRLVRCRRCGLVYVSPRPQRQAIEHAYAEVDNSLYLEQGSERSRTFARAIRWLEKAGARKGRLLDVGCAGGFFVKAAGDAGWAAEGLEISRHLCQFGRDALGVSITQGTLERAPFLEQSFDVITFWDVLEHVADPSGTLDRAKRLLKPGGHLLVNYPDYGSLWAKWLGRRWWFLIDVHIYYFTPATLAKLLEKHGFQMCLQRRHFQTLRLGYLLQRAQASFPRLGRWMETCCRRMGLQNVPVTYYAGQKTAIARNAAAHV